MILHGYFRSSASYRVRIALNLKQISYRQVSYHLRKGEQRSDSFRALNRQGLVPALEAPDGVITQSLAAISYLDDLASEPRLIPAAPLEKARVWSISLAIACEIHPLNNLRVLGYLRDNLGADTDQVNAWYRHWVETEFQALETRLASENETGRYCHGDTVTMADLCLIPQVFNARRFEVPVSDYPVIERIDAACGEIAAFRDALPARQPDAE